MPVGEDAFTAYLEIDGVNAFLAEITFTLFLAALAKLPKCKFCVGVLSFRLSLVDSHNDIEAITDLDVVVKLLFIFEPPQLLLEHLFFFGVTLLDIGTYLFRNVNALDVDEFAFIQVDDSEGTPALLLEDEVLTIV